MNRRPYADFSKKAIFMRGLDEDKWAAFEASLISLETPVPFADVLNRFRAMAQGLGVPAHVEKNASSRSG